MTYDTHGMLNIASTFQVPSSNILKDCFVWRFPLHVYLKLYEALQDIVYIWLPTGIDFGISLKRSEITQMGCFWSPFNSYSQDLTKN